MEIRIRETGQVVFENEFRSMHPNTSLPQQLTESLLDEFGADVVFEGPQATGGTVYQYNQRQGVENVNGKWFTKYVLGPIFDDTEESTAEEQESVYKERIDGEQSQRVREDRTRRLTETDWRFRTDMNPSQEWITYCQALRDIPTQAGFPWNIEWPEQPK